MLSGLALAAACLLASAACDGAPVKAPPVGWMTWYAVKFDASERTILENAKAFRKAFGGYTDEKPVLWVDWEWFHRRYNSKGEDGEDAFTPHAASYPRGLKALADDLKGLGFTPALWVSPQVDVRTNALFAAHPDWILGSHPFWGGHVFADPTAPRFYEDYLKPAFDLYRSWGYEMFKWDCMPNTWLVYEKERAHFAARGLTPESAFRKLLEDGRRAVGDGTYLLYCHASKPYDAAFLPNRRLFDAVRIGDDVFDWEAFCRHVVKAYLDFRPYAADVLPDLDNLVLREEFNTLEQAQTRVTVYALTGVPITLGDRIDALDVPRLAMLRQAMPVVPTHPGSPDAALNEENVLSLTAPFARTWGRWQVRSWSNLSTAATARVSFEVPTGQVLWDVWNRELLAPDGGKLDFELKPCASRVVRVTPLEKDGPTLVGTSRHLTQGGYELKDFAADAQGARGMVRCPGGETVTLAFLLPEGTSVLKASHPSDLKGRLLRLNVDSPARADIPFSFALQHIDRPF